MHQMEMKITEEKRLTKIQNRQCIEKLLADEMPLLGLIIVILLNLLLCGASIGFQVTSIILQSPLYYIGTGIWISFFVLINLLFIILLIVGRTFQLYIATSLINIISAFIISLALIATNVTAVCITCPNCVGYSLLWINYVLIGIGGLFIFPPIIYIVVFRIKFYKFFKTFVVESYYIRN